MPPAVCAAMGVRECVCACVCVRACVSACVCAWESVGGVNRGRGGEAAIGGPRHVANHDVVRVSGVSKHTLSL